MNSVLTSRDFNIVGNVFRAYYDADGKLVFVLDSTIDDRKPNVLLVINPVGDRKWDDILANDYNVDLETVRPKKDNKYQKLDIEYSGLAAYDALIHAYENGADITNELMELIRFRDESIHRAASERLAMAESNAAKARDTIIRTNDSIAELRVWLKQLKSKLSQQKKQVGREPTKQSASKILKTDAQIDVINEKLRRAKKRLDNAQRRLVAADEDAETARDILARTPRNVSENSHAASVPGNNKNEQNINLPAAMASNDLVVRTDAPVPMQSDSDIDDDTDENADDNSTDFQYDNDDANNIEYDENINFNTDLSEQTKAEPMAENENDVKPLFDKDPEILDEEIAFKPIEFGVSSPASSTTTPETNKNMDAYGENMDNSPLSFAPPVSKNLDNNTATDSPINVRPVSEQMETPVQQPQTAPVLDTITSVNAPMPQNDMNSSSYGVNESMRPAPVAPDVENPNVAAAAAMATAGVAAAKPMQNIGAAPMSSGVRPVSPITGTQVPTSPAPRKPTMIYYIMLVLLIALSIFTLWLYQKNTSKNTPDLAATVPVADASVAQESVSADSPFVPEITVDENVQSVETTVAEPEPVAEPELVPEPVPTPQPEPQPEPQPVSEPSPVVEPVPVVETVPVAEPVLVIEPEPAPVIESEEEILASKPAYNVSQNEKMFIADPEYDTETLYSTETTTTVDENMPMCPDGTAPDVNGCCTGEVYTDMGEMGFNCCPESGGDCFPPLF